MGILDVKFGIGKKLNLSDINSSLKCFEAIFDEIISNPMLRNMMNEPGGAIKLNKLAYDFVERATQQPQIALRGQLDIVHHGVASQPLQQRYVVRRFQPLQ